jgi:hypothetical protein
MPISSTTSPLRSSEDFTSVVNESRSLAFCASPEQDDRVACRTGKLPQDRSSTSDLLCAKIRSKHRSNKTDAPHKGRISCADKAYISESGRSACKIEPTSHLGRLQKLKTAEFPENQLLNVPT